MVKIRLYFAILLIHLEKSTAQKDFFITHKHGTTYNCVTNSSFALSWIKEDIEEDADSVSAYIPRPDLNSFNCNITDDNRTRHYFVKTPWELKKPQDSDINEIILDERWEEMKTFLTKHEETREAPLQFVPVLSGLKSNFEIPLSLRTEMEAHIFLCDGPRPYWSNCYWFMLEAFRGNLSAIRKCEVGSIPHLAQRFPTGPCRTLLTTLKHPESPEYLFADKWSHFKLTKRGNRLSFSQDERKILELQDEEEIHVTDMIIHSKLVNGFWKIHNVDFIYTNESTDQVGLGGQMRLQDPFLCLSMYVSMCGSCKIVLATANDEQILDEKIYQVGHLGWQKIDFVSDNVHYPDKEITLLVSTIGGNTTQQYWAIDKVRLCRKKEFRTITSREYAKCQSMGDARSIAIVDSFSASESRCPESTIGGFCVPCTWIYENCGQIKICNKDKCTCSAGYVVEDHCRSPCHENRYGHGCKERCGRCKYYCEGVEGTCLFSRCTDGYTGPKCDTPPSITFSRPPLVVNVTYTSATILVKDFGIKNPLTDQKPVFYTIQYKQADDHNSSWMSYRPDHKFNTSQSVMLEDLAPGTRYAVRSVITTSKSVQFTGPEVKVTEFVTRCREISNGSVDVTPSNTSVRIFLKQKTESCKLDEVIVFLKEFKALPYYHTNGIDITNLKPFTWYTIKFRRNAQQWERRFRTGEGIPQKVKNLVVIDKSSSTVRVKWEEPMINGKFEHYVVQYGRASSIACNVQSKNPSTVNSLKVKSTSVTIADLIPYSQYRFSVFAANGKFEGPPVVLWEATLAANEIKSDEIPDARVTPGVRGVIIDFSSNCSKIRGPLVVTSTAICTSEWCKKQNRNVKTMKASQEMVLNGLIPFSNYSLDLTFCRNYTNCESGAKRQTFTTKPTFPNGVSDLLVYTKNESSVSLRWKPPYPPTGILERYKINYYAGRSLYKKIAEFGITPCRLWPDLHCATLRNLESNEEYSFLVNAKNKDSPEFGPTVAVEGRTKIENVWEKYNWAQIGAVRWTIWSPTVTSLSSSVPKSQNCSFSSTKLLSKDLSDTISFGKIKFAIFVELEPFGLCKSSSAPYGLTIKWTIQNDLKLEWNHPNRSNGEIKFFCINVTSARNKIQNQLTLTKGYKLTYVHRVDAAQLLPLILYTVSISANNGLEGEILTAKDTSPPRIPSLEQDPRIVASNNTVVVPKPANGSRQSTYGLYLLVADHQGSTYVHPQFKIHEKELRLRLSKSKIVYQVENFNRSETIDIVTRSNLSLVSGEVYNVTVIVTNTSANKTSYKVYHLTFSVPKSNIVFLALLVLLLIPVCIFCVWYRFKTRCKNKKETPPELDYYNLRSISRREQTEETKCQKRAGSLSRLVQISEFERYVAETENNEDLQHQHSLVLQNRNSVVYEVLCGNQYFDYIDLEFTDGTKITKAYIAAEAPKPTSVDYFWKAVWEENVEHIVSLVPRDGNSAEEYFPREDKKMEFQNISVLLGFDKTLSNYQYRTFILINQDQIRQVDHIVLRYRGEDALEFVPTLRKMLKYPLRTHSPIFICSSGSVKMTGFILLCDMCLRMADKDGVVDVLKNLKQLSTYTADLVCDVEQYKLAHRVVSECLFNKQLL